MLDRTWTPPRGPLGWLRPVNQRVIGQRFIVTAFIFFVFAGVLALVMRAQLAVPGNQLVGAEWYNQLFTTHGTTMMFLFGIPMIEGLGIYLMPLMIGTRDMPFPRLNAFGYYIFLIGGITFFTAFILGHAPDAGWFSYPPLVEKAWSEGAGVSVYATVITFVEVAALVAAVEQIVAILKLRAPGMTLPRVPIFVWAILVVSFMIVFAMPGVIVASVMLALDRTLDMGFYLAEKGGDPLLWQHQFWWFGHPEVYILMLPGFGVISHVITTFSRRPLFGYAAVVLSIISIGFISFGLWVHHMFATGLPPLAASFFTAASIVIAIPSGVQVFCWIATLWGSRPVWRTPLWFALGSIVIFVVGGVTGVMVASVPFDLQVHDTFFVVAHFHYVLFGSLVFPMFAAFFYWYPKWTGRLLSERLGLVQFWTMFVGMHVAFLPMHQLGFDGMPRRVYTYLEGLGWSGLNLTSTIGAFIFAAGVLLFVLNVIVSRFFGLRAGENPWDADTLEWATASPPASYAFRSIPTVNGRNPLWQWRDEERRSVVAGLRDDRREVLLTTPLDARISAVGILPGPTLWPAAAAAAAAIGFIGVIFTPWAFIAGFLLTFVAVTGWLWPSDGTGADADADAAGVG